MEASLVLNVGLGTVWVKVTILPSVSVEKEVEVIKAGGGLEVEV